MALVEDNVLMTRLTLLVDTLSRGQWELLTSFLGDIDVHTRQNLTSHITSAYENTKVNWQYEKMIIKGKHSIQHSTLENVPRPTVYVDNEHTYVHLHDCIADPHAHGTEVDSLLDENTVNTSVERTKLGFQKRQKT